MARQTNPFRGEWRIASTDVWDDLDVLGPAYLAFGRERTGELQLMVITVGDLERLDPRGMHQLPLRASSRWSPQSLAQTTHRAPQGFIRLPPAITVRARGVTADGPFHFTVGNLTQTPLDHGLLDRPQDTSDDRWEQKPGTCPVSEDIVAEESPPHVTGYGRDYDVLPAAVVAGELRTRTRRILRPGSSEKTNGTRTTSPRLQPIVRSVSAIVPEICEHRIRFGSHARGIRTAQVLMDPIPDGV
jgi:hypothetical protein